MGTDTPSSQRSAGLARCVEPAAQHSLKSYHLHPSLRSGQAYDPLHRLTGAEYSTGERYEYAYDAVGNRTVYTETTPANVTRTTQYEYDAANRLLISSSPRRLITYTWDARGNLIGDGTFTYAYNAAGRLVRAAWLAP